MSKVRGADELIKKLKRMDARVQKETRDIVFNIATDIETEALAKAPKDIGQLIGSISKEKLNNGFSAKVSANAPHAPFIEFGTRSRAIIPAGFESLAAQFKGQKGGNFKDFVKNIAEWCKGKGIDPKLAYIIALSIMKKGIKPQPFLIPAFIKARINIVKELKDLLERETKK